jgi:very-short-patch-repair endonuclease
MIDAKFLSFASEMRRNPAPAEQKLWECLRDRQLRGFKFRRQHVSGKFITDFYCHQIDLIVEIDGDSHDRRATYDASRTKILERDGMVVIRFVNQDVFDFLNCVLEEVLRQCEVLAAGKGRPSP